MSALTVPSPQLPGLEQGQTQARIMTVQRAINYLHSLRLPLTFTEATAYLQSLWHRANLLTLYRHYFPVEFAASITPASPIELEYKHRSFNSYSPKEKEFLELVNERLFPFYLEHLLEAEEAEEREDVIYIPNFGVDYWTYELEELHPGWHLLLLLTGSIEQDFSLSLDDTEANSSAEFKTALAMLGGHTVNWDRFNAAALARIEPLSYLPLAFEMLDHDTGNIFLDPTDEMPVEPLEWSIEDMDFLIEHYQEANQIGNKATKLLDWLIASPLHLLEVITLWNECLELAPLVPTAHPL